MKKRFIALAAEAAALNLLALLFIYEAYMEPLSESGKQSTQHMEAGIIVAAIIYAAVIALIVIQGYFTVIKPYDAKIKELEEAAEENKKAEVIRREFVANVSHELKTPLTSIMGFIETLQAGAADDAEIRNKFIDIIAIETSRLKRLIDDLLVLSDIESKRIYEEGEFNAAEALSDTLKTLEPITGEKGMRVLTDFDESVKIKGSRDRFCQMMMNLIENAVKYSEEGKRIWIDVKREGEKIIVSVRDEGIGIAPEHYDRLFERFYRVDKSRSKKVGGTGLGLSIVKHIAALFGAALKVESKVGEGSTFYVIFDGSDEKKKEPAE